VELLALRDGTWAFVGNDLEDGRYRLALFLSDNEGKSWKWKTYLENEPKGGGSFSYPCLTQSADGLLRITYSYSKGSGGETIKYVVVDPAAVKKL